MTDRKTPMQRYRDVADRELLRRVAEEVHDECADRWITEDYYGYPADLDLWAIIDRVLAAHAAATESEYERGVREGIAEAAWVAETGGGCAMTDESLLAEWCRKCGAAIRRAGDELLRRTRAKDAAAQEGE